MVCSRKRRQIARHINTRSIHADCDMIMGPIATDTLFETYGIITSA